MAAYIKQNNGKIDKKILDLFRAKMEVILDNNNLIRFENKVVISIINLSMIETKGLPGNFSEDILNSIKYKIITICLISPTNNHIVDSINEAGALAYTLDQFKYLLDPDSLPCSAYNDVIDQLANIERHIETTNDLNSDIDERIRFREYLLEKMLNSLEALNQ